VKGQTETASSGRQFLGLNTDGGILI